VANPEHLAKLKEGVEAWNQWRNSNPSIKPDLSESDLDGANLSEALTSLKRTKAALRVPNPDPCRNGEVGNSWIVGNPDCPSFDPNGGGSLGRCTRQNAEYSKPPSLTATRGPQLEGPCDDLPFETASVFKRSKRCLPAP
jgi:hypothetical protein